MLISSFEFYAFADFIFLLFLFVSWYDNVRMHFPLALMCRALGLALVQLLSACLSHLCIELDISFSPGVYTVPSRNALLCSRSLLQHVEAGDRCSQRAGMSLRRIYAIQVHSRSFQSISHICFLCLRPISYPILSSFLFESPYITEFPSRGEGVLRAR